MHTNYTVVCVLMCNTEHVGIENERIHNACDLFCVCKLRIKYVYHDTYIVLTVCVCVHL